MGKDKKKKGHKKKMKYVAAYLLSNLGRGSGSKADIKKILDSIGANVEDDKLDSFLKAVEGKTAADLIAEGSSKLASVPSGGAVAASCGGGGAAAAPAADDKKADAAPAKAESEDEDDDDMGFDLFD